MDENIFKSTICVDGSKRDICGGVDKSVSNTSNDDDDSELGSSNDNDETDNGFSNGFWVSEVGFSNDDNDSDVGSSNWIEDIVPDSNLGDIDSDSAFDIRVDDTDLNTFVIDDSNPRSDIGADDRVDDISTSVGDIRPDSRF